MARLVRARRLWLAIHRWLGVGLGAMFVLIGLTGSVIVFGHAIDAWLNPGLFTPRGAGAPRPLAEIIASARARVPEATDRVDVAMPGVDYEVFVIYLYEREHPGSRMRSTQVMVDPVFAEVLGSRKTGTNLTALIYRLHYTLLLEDIFAVRELGMYAVGVAGVLLITSAGTGVYLWWPRWRQLGQAVGLKRHGGAKRLNFDLHRAGGFWSSVVLLVLAFSGFYMIFPEWVRPLVGVVARTERPPRDLASVPIDGATPITPDRAVALAFARLSEGTPTWVDRGAQATAAYRVWFRRPGAVRRVYGDTQVWIDQWSGEVLRVRDSRTLPAGEAFLHWQFPLHSGEAFGLPGRLIVFFSGLAPGLLAVTGTLIWWRKRRARRRMRRREGAPVPWHAGSERHRAGERELTG